jgi:hypothetical protein
MRLFCLFSIFIFPVFISAQIIPFDTNPNQTVTYEECIAIYTQIAEESPLVKIIELGPTDVGEPLHLVIISKEGYTQPEQIKNAGKAILWINNGIHPGEPEGIDASIMLTRDLVSNTERQDILDKLVIAIVPIYNVGGALNRNSFFRANQNGPESYGFRGNAKNLDLNRDFIKCDSRNAQTMVQAISKWDPDVFVDTHTSNGADYPYTVTLIETQKDKIEAPLQDYLTEVMTSGLYKEMKRRNWEMIPYVNANGTPDKGIDGFLESPRYSTGFTTQHHILGYTLETHMWKPFKDRVWATYHFLDAISKITARDADLIQQSRVRAKMSARNKGIFPLSWKLDKSSIKDLPFKGYEAGYKKSKVSGLDRLYYDRDQPFETAIPYRNDFKPDISVQKPVAYLIPQAYQDVIDRLRWNGVDIKQLTDTVTLELDHYRIQSYETTNYPYESHYLHYNTEVEKIKYRKIWRKGDYVVFANQINNRVVIENLEPHATDSYFAWNFFDGILMQKEYFSSYVFEETAAAILKEKPELREALEKRQQEDADFASNARAQLDFIYKHSKWYEPTHKLYPVGRLEAFTALPIQ